MFTDAPFSNLPDPIRQPEFYADVTPKRFVAWVIDGAIALALTVLAIPFTMFIAAIFFPLFWLLIGFAYRVITLANGSATLGMRFMGIEMRRHDGARFTLQDAFLHTAGYSMSLTAFPVQALSIILMFTTPRGQGLTDMVLGTVALNRRAR